VGLERGPLSSVGIATSYGPDDRGLGVRVPVGSRIVTSPCRPDPALGLLRRRYRGLGVKLTTHFHPVPMSRKRGSIRPLPPYAFTTLA
jgi:hypothetical protein